MLTSGPRDLPPASRRCGTRSNGVRRCSRPASAETWPGSRSSPAAAPSTPRPAVIGADLDRLGALVDHSLLQRDPAAREPRFRMLETVREYGLELLGPRPARARASARGYFTGLAESAELVGPEQPRWLEKLDEEQDNLRVAIDRAASRGDAELELRLAGALWRFWWLRARSPKVWPTWSARSSTGGTLRRSSSPRPVAAPPASRGVAATLAQARELAERGLEAAPVSGDGVVELSCHTVLGLVARDEGDSSGRARISSRAPRSPRHSAGKETSSSPR